MFIQVPAGNSKSEFPIFLIRSHTHSHTHIFIYIYKYMGGSIYGGTPKRMVYKWKIQLKLMIWRYPLFQETSRQTDRQTDRQIDYVDR